MCGIAGLFNLDGSKVDQGAFYRAVECIRHRGPDDEGAILIETATGRFEERGGPDSLPELGLRDLREPTPLNANFVMANRRLAIIDLSSKGHQPKHNEDCSIWLVFNGEVYNYRNLRKELLESGHEFLSNTDTEVVVHGYEEWGIDLLLSKMVGMWGFALWDQRIKKLYLVRDRFGIKPLYWYMDSKSLIFGSEIKIIRSLYGLNLNEKRILEFLWFLPYNPEETFFEGVKQIMPAHYMEFNFSNKEIKKIKYWDIKVLNNNYIYKPNYVNVVNEFYELLRCSLKYHMVSDVPVGTCLSGGLDSSTIVCLSQKLLREDKILEKGLLGVKKFKTFSSIPKEERVSEEYYIKKVVNWSGVEPHSVSPTLEEFLKDFDETFKFHDEPYQNPSVYMQYRVMKLASKKSIKVLLDGQGADELLGGYHSYLRFYLRDLMRSDPIRFFKESIKISDLIVPLMWRFIREKIGFKRYLMNKMIKIKPYRKESFSIKSFVEKLKYDLLEGSLLELLKYEDVNSMAFSIESRVPFLYHPLVEFLFEQPMNMRINDGWTKYILRESMRGIIPEEVRMRRSKLGFPAPDVEWAKRLITERRSWCMSLVNNAERYVDLKSFEKLCDRIVKSGWYEDVLLFWRILILSKWLETLKGVK